MNNWFVILNPFAARGKAGRKEQFIRQKLFKAGINFEFVISKSREDATQIIHSAIRKGFRKFITVGGDGSFNQLVNSIFTQSEVPPSEIIIAIIPAGTGNDWIKTHHIHRSIHKVVEIIKAEETDFHDIGVVINNDVAGEKRYFINVSGFAFQGFVAERIEGTGKWIKIGAASFYLGLLDALFRYKTTLVKVDLFDDPGSAPATTLHERIFSISAGICRYAGGGMKLTPHAIPHDGLFDITVARDLSRFAVIKNVFRLFNGSFVLHRKISQFRAKKISITSIPPLPAETDGEVLGRINTNVEILRRAIRVVVP